MEVVLPFMKQLPMQDGLCNFKIPTIVFVDEIGLGKLRMMVGV